MSKQASRRIGRKTVRTSLTRSEEVYARLLLQYEKALRDEMARPKPILTLEELCSSIAGPL